MNTWPIEQTKENLSILLANTVMNLLAFAELENIEAMEKNLKKHNSLQTNTNSNLKLIKALRETPKNSSAWRILLAILFETISNLRIVYRGQTKAVKDLSSEHFQNVLLWLKKNLSTEECLKMLETIFIQEATSKLALDMRPATYSIYFPKMLPHRQTQIYAIESTISQLSQKQILVVNKEVNWTGFWQRLSTYHTKIFDELFGKPKRTTHKTKMLVNILQDLSTTQISNNRATRKPTNSCLDGILKTFVNTRFYAKYQDIFSALFYAAVLEGYTEVARLCLNFDPALVTMTVKLYDESIPILFIARCAELFDLLVNHGASIFEVDSEGQTILHFLGKSGSEYLYHYVVLYLGTLWENSEAITKTNIEKPTSLTELFNWPTKYSQKTPLHYAISLKHHFWPDTLNLFVHGGKQPSAQIVVNLNAVDNNGNTALHIGLKHCCSINNIKCLVEYGADIKIRNNKGCNVAHICAQENLTEHLKYFIKKGVNVNQVDCMGNNALQCGLANLSEWYRGKDLHKLVTVFLNAGSDTAQINIKNQTVYDIAKSIEYSKKILEMLGGKVSVNKSLRFDTLNNIDEPEQAALFTALQQGCSLDNIKDLVNRGIEVKRKNKNGCNVAHICVQKCLSEHLEYFMKMRVSVNEVDNRGNNALQCGLVNFQRNKYTDLINVFLILEEAGVNKSQLNLENKTAYDIAKESGRWCDSILEMFKFEVGKKKTAEDQPTQELPSLDRFIGKFSTAFVKKTSKQRNYKKRNNQAQC